jgi:hypothetical protein
VNAAPSFSIYQADLDPAPEADFQGGALEHLVADNHGRLPDARRTPITVTAVTPERARSRSSFESQCGSRRR